MSKGTTKAFITHYLGEIVVEVKTRLSGMDGSVYILDTDGVEWETHISNVIFMTTPSDDRKDDGNE